MNQLLTAFLLIAMLAGPADVERTLQLSSRKLLEVPAVGFFGQARCDNEGNLFVHSDIGSYNEVNIVELSPRSGEPTLFRLPQGLEQKGVFSGFSITPAGRVWALEDMEDGKTLYLTGFDSSGKVSSRQKVETPEHFTPGDFAVSDHETLLLSGYFDSGASEQQRGKAYAALFGPSGELRKVLNEELPSVDVFVTRSKPHEGGTIFAGDGNLYLLHSQGVLVLSESGAVVRRITFQKPDPEMRATSFAYSGGWLCIWLMRVNKDGSYAPEYLLIDASTGKTQALYKPAEELGKNAVCFSRDHGFTFFDNLNGRVTLSTARLQ